MQETQVTRAQSLGREDPLEKGMATRSRILAWRTPYSPWSRKESDTTERLSLTLTPVFLPGESHGQRSLAGYIC